MSDSPPPVGMPDAFTGFHIRFGWVVLALFLAAGIVLELLHGFRVDWYLDVGTENRRLMFTLAHAHGALLGLLNIVFAVSGRWLAPGVFLSVASWGLRIGTLVLPAGFFLGGLVLAGTDPGLGVFLAPVGGAVLVVAVASAAVASFQASPTR